MTVKQGVIDEVNTTETLIDTGFAQCYHYNQYSRMYTCSPPALFVHSAALEPTCTEELEALNAAPPWAGYWLEKPTLRQRLRGWIRYARYRLGLWN